MANGPTAPQNVGPRPRTGTNQEGRGPAPRQRQPGSDAHPRVRKAGNHQKLHQPSAAEMAQFNQYFGNVDSSGKPKSQGASQPTNNAGKSRATTDPDIKNIRKQYNQTHLGTSFIG